MDNELMEGGVWIPIIGVCRHERSGGFKLIHYGAREDSGMSFSVGNLIPIEAEAMAKDALRIILDGLAFYRVWPAKTKLESEVGVMDTRLLSKFVREHKFVDVLKRDRNSLCVSPCYREGGSWKGVRSYIEQEIPVRPSVSQERFFEILTGAFDLAK